MTKTRGLYGEPSDRIPVEFDSSRFLNSDVYLPGELDNLFHYIDSYILDDGCRYKIDIEFKNYSRSHVSTSSFKSSISAKAWLGLYKNDLHDISKVIISKEEVN